MADITIHEEMPGRYLVYGSKPATCDGFDELIDWLARETGREYNQRGLDGLNQEIDRLEEKLEETQHRLDAVKETARASTPSR